MAVTLEHVPGQGFKVSGIIAYTELSGLKDAKAYERNGETVQGSKFRSAFNVIRMKNVTVEGFGPATLADAKFQATLTVRNFRTPPTAAELAERKTQATVSRVKGAISELSELAVLRLMPRYAGKSDEELQAILDATE